MSRLAQGLALAALVATAALTGLACATTAPPAPGDGSSASRRIDTNATLHLGTQGIMATMDPHTATGGIFQTAVRAVMDPLILTVDGGRREPGLALSWENINPTTWQLKLRPNVVFHNGEPFTAEAVKFTLDRVRDPANQLAAATRTTTIADVVVVDDLTVNIVTRQPDPILPENIRLVQIIPPRYFREVGPEGFAQRPVGTGLWRLNSFNPSQEFVGDRFEQAWQGPAKVRQLRISALPETAARMAALRSGQVDLIDRVPPDEIDTLGREGFQMIESIGGTTTAVFFEMLQDTPVARRDVRLALNHATNKEAAQRAFSGGKGLIIGQMGNPDATGWNSDIRPFAFDPARAKQLMTQAGLPDGFAMKFHVSNAAGRLGGLDMASFLKAEWERHVNVRIELEPIEQGRFMAMFFSGGYNPMRLGTLSFGEEVAFAMQYFVFEGQRSPPLRRYRNDDFDRIYLASTREMNPERREQLLREAAMVLHQDAAMVFIANEASGIAISKPVEGFRVRPGFNHDWSQVTKAAN